MGEKRGQEAVKQSTDADFSVAQAYGVFCRRPAAFSSKPAKKNRSPPKSGMTNCATNSCAGGRPCAVRNFSNPAIFSQLQTHFPRVRPRGELCNPSCFFWRFSGQCASLHCAAQSHRQHVHSESFVRIERLAESIPAPFAVPSQVLARRRGKPDQRLVIFGGPAAGSDQ